MGEKYAERSCATEAERPYQLRGTHGRITTSLSLKKNLDQRARERFTSSMRAWVLTDLAGQMQLTTQRPDSRQPDHDSGEAVHQFLKDRGLFKWYSSLRCATQELVWQSVLRAIESDPQSLNKHQSESPLQQAAPLTLIQRFTCRTMREMDVHLMPGNYQGGEIRSAAAAIMYDNGLDVFSFGVWVKT